MIDSANHIPINIINGGYGYCTGSDCPLLPVPQPSYMALYILMIFGVLMLSIFTIKIRGRLKRKEYFRS